MTISKETKVGIFALVSFVILYLGFNFLKGKDFFSSQNKYTVIYDNVEGLTVANQVSVSGMKVGQVKIVELMAGNKVKVTLVIRKDLPLPIDTKAILSSDGLLGGKLIRLEMGKANKVLANEGRILSGRETGISDLIKEQALPLLHNLDSLTLSLRVVTKSFEATGSSVNGLVKNTDKTISTLAGTVGSTIAENRTSLAGITANMKALSGNLIETERSLKPLIGKFSSIADSLNALKISQAVATTQRSLEGLHRIMLGIESGQGSMGKLLKDDSLYSNINRSVANLDKLLIDFRLAPRRYVNVSIFGGKKADPPTVK